jgi:hypothetical protein
VLCHAGYDLDADDVRDLEALRDRFDVELPEPLLSKHLGWQS